ncbi:hypothetical protein K461DRAFT_270860 [Myriangium duriaei CBS 260.36]|uniref:Uncharacterized protein n=1 Tax=Myriangium duriaei CBS 260.36 TaxID=1168546 RepID=A0A9P4IVH6_9PEZI|nr:hypothetical protein K461DRAFT_270860 [Myriangium duriaei CBS 260.36]
MDLTTEDARSFDVPANERFNFDPAGNAPSDPGLIGLLAFEQDHVSEQYGHTHAGNVPDSPPQSKASVRADLRYFIERIGLSSRGSAAHWIPFWLSLPFLIVFSISLLLLGASAIYLWKLSQIEHNFSIPAVTHYTWTFGPTALLTVFMVLWKPVIYHSKLLQPWKQMYSSDPAVVAHGMVQDYISPLELYSNLSHADPLLDDNADIALDFEAYNLLSGRMPFPDGLQPRLAFQRFSIPNIAPVNTTDAQVRSIVDVFLPEIQCEPASLSFPAAQNFLVEGIFQSNEVIIHYNTSWASCPSSWTDELQFTIDPSPDNPTRELTAYTAWGVACRGYDDSRRVLIKLLDIRYNQSSIAGAGFRIGNHNNSDTWSLQIVNSTAVICDVGYHVDLAQVTYDFAKNSLAIQVEYPISESSKRFVDGFPQDHFYEILANFDASRLHPTDIDNPQTLRTPTALPTLMRVASEIPIVSFLNDSAGFANLSATILEYIGVQVARSKLITDTSSFSQGQISRRLIKLQVSLTITWIIAGSAVLAAICVTVVAFTRPREMPPWRLGSIHSTAVLLLRSPDFYKALERFKHMETREILRRCALLLGSRLNKEDFLEIQVNSALSNVTPAESSVNLPDSRERRSSSPFLNPETGESQERPVTWWTPMLLRPICFSLVLAFPVFIMIVLEILQHMSNKAAGITSTDNPFCFVHFYDNSDYSIAYIGNYDNLKRGSSKHEGSIGDFVPGDFLPWAFCRAMSHQHWAASLLMFSAFLGGFLTIIVSGLYNFESAPSPATLELHQVDHFVPTWPDNIQDDGGAAVTLSGLYMLNLSFPPLTNAEMAFPTLMLSADQLQKITNSRSPQITATVPAFRADLHCSPATAHADVERILEYALWITAYGSANAPSACHPSTSTIEWDAHTELNMMNDPRMWEANWFGKLRDHSHNFFHGDGLGLDLPGCPSLGITFGNYSFDQVSSSSTSNFVALSCYQLMALVQTEVTLSVPNMTVLSAIPNESGTTYLKSDGSILGQNRDIAIANAFTFRIQSHFELGAYAGGDEGNVVILNPGNWYPEQIEPFDNFFHMLFHSFQGMEPPFRPDDFLGQGEASQERLSQATTGLYRRYMAQVANSKMRVPIINGTNNTIPGTWIDADRAVLRQNKVPKIILQVLLGIMFECGLAAFFLIDTKEVLPHNPCSIAGTIRLLDGSKFCDARYETDTANELDAEEWAESKRKEWSGKRFRMGWWESDQVDGERWYGIDVDHGKKRDN